MFHGIKVAVRRWIGFLVPSFATKSVFEARTWAFFAITIGMWLIGMIVMGAL